MEILCRGWRAVEDPDALYRYALALGLVGDEGVAGDLVLAARDRDDLLRRAARWRAARGLPPAPVPEPLTLAAEQQAQARRLARQLQRRRHLRPWLAAGAAALLTAGLAAALPAYRDARTGLAADPAFAAPPAETSAPAAGPRLAIYRAEASPGTVTVW